MTFTLIVLLAAVFLAGWAVGLYNHLVKLRGQVKNAWAQIDVQLQRRYDLIPNLIETVKGYMNYEKGTLESVIAARSAAVAAKERIGANGGPTETSLQPLLAAEGQLRGALANVFALAENYPDLKASENMRVLQEELSSTENKIAFARQAYNDQAMVYNIAQQQFPAVMFAKMLGHSPADLYEVSDVEAKKPVKVAF